MKSNDDTRPSPGLVCDGATHQKRRLWRPKLIPFLLSPGALQLRLRHH